MTERLRTLTIKNGAPPEPTFSSEEMARRVAMLRVHMANSGIEVAVLTSMHCINYFADFVYTAFGRNYALVVTESRSTTISANIDGGQPWRQTYGQDNLVYTDWHKDNFFVAVKQLVGTAMTVGVELDHLTVQNQEKLELALPGRELVDVSQPAMQMRMRKSKEEIGLIKAGARICDLGGVSALEAIAEGVPEYEVALHANRTMIREIARTFPHTELMDTWTWLQSGINTDGAHNPLTTRKIQRGEILSLNTFAMISGYYQALERTLFLAYCSERALALWEVNVQVHRRGLELISPGVRCCDVAAELNEIYRTHGLLAYRTFGYGHSFGTLSHYYGREAGLELREDVETVLEPQMVVSMEPMIMIPEGRPGAGGYREHDILVVTREGADNLTGFPFGPEHNIIH
ncbi:MAG: aminopeptidase P family protein [Pseudomonadota bacterium]|nr:aminopeptidase P family protein [Pseudomonadota bacterium]